MIKLNPPREDDWYPPWTCQWTGKWQFTFAPDFSGIDPDTGEPWSPTKIVQILDLKMASSDDTLKACEKVLAENAKEVLEYKNGKTKLLGFFMRKVLEETNKQASPQEVNKILTELLK